MTEAFTKLVDLAVDRNGGVVEAASDEFFAPKERLNLAEDPITRPGIYTENGKWMDGWESRRKRTPGNDWCIVRLGLPGRILGADIDTTHFVGNHPPEASIDAADESREGRDPENWTPLLHRVPLKPNEHNYYEVADVGRVTHVRLNIYPDGGVARLRVFGEVMPDWSAVGPGDVVELSSLSYGGVPIACNDEHFGRMMNLLQVDPPSSMGDGWETRRRRSPGYDWVVIRLGAPGTLERLEVDTTHFKGNHPDRCSVDACRLPDGSTDLIEERYVRILDETKLDPNALHMFINLVKTGPFSHLRLNIYPDGGIARFRAFGRVASKDR
ncbi:MAG: allantoicase [Rhodothermales bacterium]